MFTPTYIWVYNMCGHTIWVKVERMNTIADTTSRSGGLGLSAEGVELNYQHDMARELLGTPQERSIYNDEESRFELGSENECGYVKANRLDNIGRTSISLVRCGKTLVLGRRAFAVEGQQGEGTSQSGTSATAQHQPEQLQPGTPPEPDSSGAAQPPPQQGQCSSPPDSSSVAQPAEQLGQGASPLGSSSAVQQRQQPLTPPPAQLQMSEKKGKGYNLKCGLRKRNLRPRPVQQPAQHQQQARPLLSIDLIAVILAIMVVVLAIAVAALAYRA